MGIPFMIFLAAVGAIVVFGIVCYNRNAVIRDLNTAMQEFPSNIVAGFFQSKPHAYFELDRPDERQVPKVSFGG